MHTFTFHPGETKVINFYIPFKAMDVAAVVLSFRDRDHLVFEVPATSFGDVDEQRMKVGYTFTQGESLLFQENHDYTMQLNVFSHNSSRATSKDMKVRTLSQHIYETSYGSDEEDIYSWQYDANKSDGDYRAVSYTQLLDKPSINNIELEGNRNLAEARITNEQIDAITSDT